MVYELIICNITLCCCLKNNWPVHRFAHDMTADLLWHGNLWLAWTIGIKTRTWRISTRCESWAPNLFVTWVPDLVRAVNWLLITLGYSPAKQTNLHIYSLIKLAYRAGTYFIQAPGPCFYGLASKLPMRGDSINVKYFLLMYKISHLKVFVEQNIC